MVKCICKECECGDTFDCLHQPNNEHCKCCVDESRLKDEGWIWHIEDLMIRT